MRVACGLRFEGLASAVDTQLVIAYGDPVAGWVGGLLAPPEVGSTGINPLTGTWTTGSLRADIAYTDELAALLLQERRRSPLKLSGSIAATTTSLTLTAPYGGEGFPYLWMGDECLKIVSGIGPAYTVARGQLGTTAQAHASGDFVFDAAPYMIPRMVELLYHDLDSGATWVEWRGYINAITPDGARISIDATEFYARWQSATANDDAPPLYGLRYKEDRLYGQLRTPVRTPGNVYPKTVTLHVMGALIPATAINAELINVDARLGDGLLGSSLDFDADYYTTSTTTREQRATNKPKWWQLKKKIAQGSEEFYVTTDETVPLETPVNTPAYEVLVWDASTGIGPTLGVDRYHPLRIALYLLIANPPWGLRLPIDTAGFSAATNATSGLVVRRLALGLDGEPYAPFEVAERLMRAHGFCPTITRDGRYSVRRLESLSISLVSEAADTLISPYPDDPLKRSPPLSAAASSVEAQVGGGLPWERPIPVKVNASTGSARANLLLPREVVRYDLSHLSPRDAQTIALQLASAASLVHYSAPRLTVRVADWRLTGASFDLLAYVTLADLGPLAQPWWVDARGVRVASLTGRLDAIGYILERRLLTDSRTYELTIALQAFIAGTYARERAPHAEILSVEEKDEWFEFTCDGFPGDFDDGDDVAQWSQAGVFLNQMGSVLFTTPTLIAIRKPVIFSVGNVIRFSNSTIYSNAVRYPFTTRPCVALADATETIDRASTTEPADPYGGALGTV